MPKKYDRAYFDRWYRSPEAVADGPAYLRRKVALAVASCEYHLQRPLRSVLDIGCGEGTWRAPLRQLRPNIHYLGIDSSEYAIRRYGRARNLHRVGFAQLAEQRFAEPFDLLICSDVIHYLDAETLRRGLSGFAELGHGLAWIELFCRGDQALGDTLGWYARPASFYRRRFADAGLLAVGNHGYLLPALHASAAALERLDLPLP